MMQRFLVALMCLVGLAVFSGCSTLSKEECMTGDWYSLGLRDGQSGKTMQRYGKYQESCSEYGVVVNRELYTKGRDEGLKSYCTPENGYDEGIRGNTYLNVCPRNLEAAFLKKYNTGREIYKLTYELDRATSEITQLENRMDETADSYERRRIRWEIRDLRRKKDRLQRKLMVYEIKGHTT